MKNNENTTLCFKMTTQVTWFAIMIPHVLEHVFNQQADNVIVGNSSLTLKITVTFGFSSE